MGDGLPARVTFHPNCKRLHVDKLSTGVLELPPPRVTVNACGMYSDHVDRYLVGKKLVELFYVLLSL